MRERNPFLIRTAERISNEDDFIKLFSPKIIEIIRDNLEGHSLWNQFFRFQSSPGGGKTSLLRLFSPAILFRLKQIYKTRVDSNADIDSLFKNLKLLEVYNQNEELNVLTTYISCASDYDNISNLNENENKKKRLFFSLMNARIIISFVRTFLEFLKVKKPGANFKDELKKLKIIPNSLSSIPSDFPLECNGLELYSWSGKLEQTIYKEIDGLKNDDENISEHSGLFAIQLLTNSQIHFEDKTNFPENFAIFFDDAQKLALEQYNLLSNEIIEKRPSNGIWFAERLDLFNLDQLWSKDASTGGRDYVQQINLEEILKRRSKFKEFSINVAEKRVEKAKDISLNSFPSTLMNEPEIEEKKLHNFIESVIKKIGQVSQNKTIYHNLIETIKQKDYNHDFEKLCELRILQTLIERKEKKEYKEPSLFEDEYLMEEFEIAKKTLSINDAQYLLSRDFNTPFYFGFDKLVGLSSSNIEQFLAFSGRLFEHILSAKILNKDSSISTFKQESILSAEVEKRWRDLNSLSNSQEIKSLLDSLAKFCASQDDKPGYSYRGVTGFGMNLDDRKRLTNSNFWKDNPHYQIIAKTLTVAIANNLIEISIDRKQGKKGDPPKTLFFLNRWICLKYNLNFGYSGWRKVNLDTLGRWIKRGYKEKDSNTIENSNANLYDR